MAFAAEVIVLFIVAASMRLTAHHSFATVFDPDKPVTVRGVIAEIQFENPHSWFHLNVRNASGTVERWSFEATPPASLMRIGLKPGVVKAGDEVTIKGWRAKKSPTMAFARELVLADGRVFAIGPAYPPGVKEGGKF
jgi:hypothetical protein